MPCFNSLCFYQRLTVSSDESSGMTCHFRVSACSVSTKWELDWCVCFSVSPARLESWGKNISALILTALFLSHDWKNKLENERMGCSQSTRGTETRSNYFWSTSFAISRICAKPTVHVQRCIRKRANKKKKMFEFPIEIGLSTMSSTRVV